VAAPLVLEDRALRIHAYADARVLVRAVGWCAGAVVFCAILRGPELTAAASILLVAFLLCAACALLGAAWGASRDRAVVRVGDALHIEHAGRRLSFPLTSLTGARLSRAADAISLRTDRGVVIRVLLETLDEAERLLDAIAAGGGRGTWTAPLHVSAPAWARKALSTAAGVVLAAFFLPLSDPAVAFALAVLSGVSIWVLATVAGWPRLRAELVVGADGLSIRTGAQERFIPFGDIAAMRGTDLGVALDLRRGEELDLTMVPPWLRNAGRAGARRGSGVRGFLSATLAERRRDRLMVLLKRRLDRRPFEPSGGAALLERRGRPLPAWQAASRALIRDACAGYREAALSCERALEVVEDGGSPVELRVGAALALSPDDAGNAGKRLRVAIDACASRDVRAALEQAAYGELDEPTLKRALRCEAG
jgi:hypothetical protein